MLFKSSTTTLRGDVTVPFPLFIAVNAFIPNATTLLAVSVPNHLIWHVLNSSS